MTTSICVLIVMNSYKAEGKPFMSNLGHIKRYPARILLLERDSERGGVMGIWEVIGFQLNCDIHALHQILSTAVMLLSQHFMSTSNRIICLVYILILRMYVSRYQSHGLNN